MVVIDSRLKTCDTDQDVAENFNRTLALVDAGGGSGDSSVVFVEATENTLNIKPSDVIDSDKNYLDKFCILKNINNGNMTLLPELGLMINESDDAVMMAFGTETSPVTYIASISEDSYFIKSLSH